MTTLKFADTHNMVVFLSKPAESEGFEQIVDFLNAHPIKHALTVNPTIYISRIEHFWATVKIKTALVDGKKIIINEPKKKDTQVPQSSAHSDNVADEAVYKELDDSLLRAATTASSLEVEQDNGNTLQSGEDSLKLNELMELCTNLQQRVLNLETTKTTQANEIASLKRRVKKLKKKDRLRTHKMKRLYKVGLSGRVESFGDEEDLGKDASKQGRRIHDIDVDEDITLVNDDNKIFDVDTLAGEEVFIVEQSGNVVEDVVDVIDAASTILVSVATITDVEITLAQALAELKSVKPKADKVVIQEPEQGTTTTTPTTIITDSY
ncbi:hypothetical protein Tco_0016360 [Tanacetum coccineum]